MPLETPLRVMKWKCEREREREREREKDSGEWARERGRETVSLGEWHRQRTSLREDG